MNPWEHKEQLRRTFGGIAPLYDSPATRFFPFCADRLVSYVRPRPGTRVLDVATGTGAVAVAFAQAVAPGGRVTAIDFSPDMLDRAAANIHKMALCNVDLHEMDPEHLEFRGGYFHAVVCSYGLFLMPDMAGALREWARVLRPGGMLAFTSFESTAFQPMLDDFLARLSGFGLELPEGPLGSQRLSSPEHCRELLLAVGLSAIDAQTVQLGYHLRDEQEWWEVVSSTAMHSLFEQIPAGEQDRFRKEHLAFVAGRKTGQGLWMDVQTCFASGTKPAQGPLRSDAR
jgi:ubiquinone/menaquinone biosynthesis C-methylase UbiE